MQFIQNFFMEKSLNKTFMLQISLKCYWLEQIQVIQAVLFMTYLVYLNLIYIKFIYVGNSQIFDFLLVTSGEYLNKIFNKICSVGHLIS